MEGDAGRDYAQIEGAMGARRGKKRRRIVAEGVFERSAAGKLFYEALGIFARSAGGNEKRVDAAAEKRGQIARSRLATFAQA
jgi:hypothetical protein